MSVVWPAKTDWTTPGASPSRRESLLRRLSAAGGDVTSSRLLLYVGRLSPEKNIDVLVNMMEILAAEASAEHHLLFAGDGGGNLVAHDATNGKPLWHTRIGRVTNAPQTYMLDGHQYLIAATGDTVWSFMLY